MSISQLLSKLDELNVFIDVVDDKLKIKAPEGKLTTTLINELKEKKQEIIDFLQKNIQDQKYIAIPSAIEKEYYELSSAQMRMYFLQQMNLNNTVYNITQFIKLGAVRSMNDSVDPGIDVKRLENTFKRLIERHESLRTSFQMVKETPTQKIHKEVDFKIEFFNKADDFVRPFDLTQAPLIRVGIIETESEERLLGIDMHHIICDGTSHEILAKDFYSLYRNESQLPTLRIHYKDYTEWQNSQKQREAIKKQEAYWLKEFSGEIPIIDIPTDFTRPTIQSLEGHKLFFEITGETALRLTNIALENGTTLYIMLLSILNILWGKISGQEDIIMGTPTAGRRHADLEGIIGMFVNTLALRNYPCEEKIFKAFLQEINKRTLEAFENQDYQFEDLVEKLTVKRDAARNPLFDLMFAWQDINTNVNTEVSPSEASNYIKPLSRFDITWAGVGNKYRLFFAIEYCTKIFKEETILKFIEFFKRIISSIIECPDRKIAQIEIITEEEKKQILIDFNDTETAYPKEMTIHRLFEEQVERTPDHIAVFGQGRTRTGSGNNVEAYPITQIRPDRNDRNVFLTYNELNEQSDQSASLLIERGVLADNIVGIMVVRSVEMIVGIMGILKSGAAYLPIDPGFPEERINYMLKDSGAKMLIRRAEKEGRMKENFVNISLDFASSPPCVFASSLPIHQTSLPRFLASDSNTLAYIIYTSGSTGKPKGVMIEHHSLVNRLNWMQKTYPLDRRDTILQKTTFTFDVSVWEIFWWSTVGARLCQLSPGGEKDPELIAQAIERNHITTMHFVPSMLSVFLDYLKESGQAKKLSTLKWAIVSGEALLPVHVEQFNDLFNNSNCILLANLYGPTEATIDVSYFNCLQKSHREEVIPIGKPIDNINLYILSRSFQPQPIGIVGELYISGIGLARGYLNRPELTAEKFISNPFIHRKKMYRSGDLARWLSDGNIKFIGRIDQQVKIRGFRIEMGEIESRLIEYQDIKEAVIIYRMDEKKEKFLCAYYVSENKITTAQLREHLAGKLPDYMIPSHFVRIEKIPLTSTGKIDRNALPNPIIEPGDGYVAPQNEMEQKLVEIWAEILGVEKTKIGIDHNFFELGGNSLKLIRLAGRIYNEFKIDVPIIAQIYNQPHIRDLAWFMTKSNLSEQPVVLLNWKKEKKIFGFPDQYGFGYGYASLGSLLKDYSFYSLTFIEEEDRINRYIDIITGLQPVGPYVFFGHSAAGKLTYVMAAALEKLGFEVSDIIFADCFFVENMAIGDNEEYYIELRKFVAKFLELNNAEFLLERVFTKATNYTKFRDNTPILEKINANVHLIISEELRQKKNNYNDPLCWKKLTNKTFQTYNGWGMHTEMLGGRDLEKNIEIIKNILDEIDFGKKTIEK